MNQILTRTQKEATNTQFKELFLNTVKLKKCKNSDSRLISFLEDSVELPQKSLKLSVPKKQSSCLCDCESQQVTSDLAAELKEMKIDIHH